MEEGTNGQANNVNEANEEHELVAGLASHVFAN
jgi:hypothetical protein